MVPSIIVIGPVVDGEAIDHSGCLGAVCRVGLRSAIWSVWLQGDLCLLIDGVRDFIS